MSWRDNLVDASYRGVKFQIVGSDYETGRRTELKQFAGQDSPSLQDFGSDASEISIDGFIIANASNGYDYFAERDALIAAVNQIGVGSLVHPYYGTIEVYPIGKIRISEKISEGGIARFSLRFVRVNEEEQKLILPSFKKQQPNVTLNSLPTDSEDFNSLIDDAAYIAYIDAADSFSNMFSAARAFPDRLSNTLKLALNKVQTSIFRIKGGITDTITDVTGTISGIIATVDSIIDTPCSIFSSIKTATETLQNMGGVGIASGTYGGTAGACSGAVRGEVTELDGILIPQTLGMSIVTEGITLAEGLEIDTDVFIPDSQINNITVTIDAFKFSIFISVAKTAIRINYLNQQDIIDMSKKISEAMYNFLVALGAEIDESGYEYTNGNPIDNTMLFSAAEDFRNIFVQAMAAKANYVTALVDYKVPARVMSALELAYDKYEDLEREDEIFDMNKLDIRNPGFLPSGSNIRILDE